MTIDFVRQRFIEQLRHAIADGEVAKRDLVRQVAVMPADQILELPADVIAALGADGLSAIAQGHRHLSGLKPRKSEPVRELEPSTTETVNRKPWNRWARTAVLVGLILYVGIIGDVARPRIASWFGAPSRTVSTAYWPTCPRLNAYVDGCLYRVGSVGLSASRAADLLDLPIEDFLKVNSHLPPSGAIPLGATMTVWRGTLELKDTSK